MIGCLVVIGLIVIIAGALDWFLGAICRAGELEERREILGEPPAEAV